MPRPYPPKFRQRALDLVRSGRSVPEVAGLLGIAESCLYRWKRQDLIDRGLEPGTQPGWSPRSWSRHGRRSATWRREQDPPHGCGRGRGGGAPKRPVPAGGRAPPLPGSGSARPAARSACLALRLLRVEDPRAPSARSIRHAWLTDLIGQVHQASLRHLRRLPACTPSCTLWPGHHGRAEHREPADAPGRDRRAALALAAAIRARPAGHRHRPGAP